MGENLSPERRTVISRLRLVERITSLDEPKPKDDFLDDLANDVNATNLKQDSLIHSLHFLHAVQWHVSLFLLSKSFSNHCTIVIEHATLSVRVQRLLGPCSEYRLTSRDLTSSLSSSTGDVYLELFSSQ